MLWLQDFVKCRLLQRYVMYLVMISRAARYHLDISTRRDSIILHLRHDLDTHRQRPVGASVFFAPKNWILLRFQDSFFYDMTMVETIALKERGMVNPCLGRVSSFKYYVINLHLLVWSELLADMFQPRNYRILLIPCCFSWTRIFQLAELGSKKIHVVSLRALALLHCSSAYVVSLCLSLIDKLKQQKNRCERQCLSENSGISAKKELENRSIPGS